MFHLRTKGGEREVDLRWLKQRRSDRHLDVVVVTTGQHAHRRRDGIGVVPLALLGP